MKNLKIKTATEEASNVQNDFLSDKDILIQKLEDRVNFLQNWLDDILVRTPEEIDSDITTIIEQLSRQTPSLIVYYVQDNYSHRYFSQEVDTEFKIALAQSILSYVKILYPNYKNELLESIANNNSKYTANYIYVEKV